MKYVHTLLFDCPHCKLPIAITLIKEEQNLEEVDAEALFLICMQCQHAFSTPAVAAKRHYVDEWPFKNLPLRAGMAKKELREYNPVQRVIVKLSNGRIEQARSITSFSSPTHETAVDDVPD